MDELSLDVETLLRQRDWLRRLARGLVRDGEVDDLLQESWLQALRGGSRPRRTLRAWFAGILRNVARRERDERHGELGGEPRAEDALDSAELLVRAELQERLSSAVRALREPYRATVLLHYFEGLTLEEVGRRTGVPSSTARTRLARALAELRSRFEGEHGGAAWAFVVALARGGAVGIPKSVLEVTRMGTLGKLSVGVAVAGIALAVWWSEAGDAGRSSASGAEASARVALQSPPPGAEPADEPGVEGRGLREPAALAREPAPAPAASDPRQAGVDAASSEASATSLERDLDKVAESFLGENFDAPGLLDVWARLAQSMPAATEEGKLELGSLRGSYTFDGGGYKVQLVAECSRAPFVKRTVSLLFTNTGGTASNLWAFVQFHPRSDKADQAYFEHEQIVGWSLQVDPNRGTTAKALTTIFDEAGWHLGNVSEVFREQHLPGLRSGAAFDAWLARLCQRR